MGLIRYSNGYISSDFDIQGSESIADATINPGPLTVTGNATVSLNLGIGTTSPLEPLHVKKTGGASINTAPQIRIETVGTTTWSSFHFTDGVTADAYVGFITGSGASTRLLGLANNTSTPNMVIDANGNVGIGTTAPTANLSIAEKFQVNSSGLVPKYNNVATTAWGVPAIYGSGRATAQTAAVASVATYTVGASDGSFLVSANVNVTTSTTHNFTVQVTYTDETNTARTLTMTVSQLAGTLITAITNVTGAGPYEGIPLHIRCKALTVITIKTSGTFTTVTYNVEGFITQIG